MSYVSVGIKGSFAVGLPGGAFQAYRKEFRPRAVTGILSAVAGGSMIRTDFNSATVVVRVHQAVPKASEVPQLSVFPEPDAIKTGVTPGTGVPF
jgi:hypothetical protein